MSLRQLCKETGSAPKKALLYFSDESTMGIASTKLIFEKDVDVKEGHVVTVNWEWKKVCAEIIFLAVIGKLFMFTNFAFSETRSIRLISLTLTYGSSKDNSLDGKLKQIAINEIK